VANFTGESFTAPFPTAGAQSCAGSRLTSPFKTDAAQSSSAQRFLSPCSPNFFMMRARDSGAPPGPAVYVTWEVTRIDIATPYPGIPPFGGPLVDTVFWALNRS